MAKKGHGEEEILRVLWEAESGATVVEIGSNAPQLAHHCVAHFCNDIP